MASLPSAQPSFLAIAREKVESCGSSLVRIYREYPYHCIAYCLFVLRYLIPYVYDLFLITGLALASSDQPLVLYSILVILLAATVRARRRIRTLFCHSDTMLRERKRKSPEPFQTKEQVVDKEVAQQSGVSRSTELGHEEVEQSSQPTKRSRKSVDFEKQYVLPDRLFSIPPPPQVPTRSMGTPTENRRAIVPVVSEPNLSTAIQESEEGEKHEGRRLKDWSVFDVSSGLATELFPKRESDICLIEGDKENSLTQFPHLGPDTLRTTPQPYKTKAFQERVTFEKSREKLPADSLNAGDQFAFEEDFALSEESYGLSTDYGTDEKVTYVHYPSPVPDFPNPERRRKIRIELPKDIPSETSKSTEVSCISELCSARREGTFEHEFPLSCTESSGLCQSWLGCFSLRKGLRWRKCNVVFEDDYLEISAASLKGHERNLLRYPVSNFSVRTKNSLKCGPGQGSILILSSPNLPEVSLRVFDNSIKCEFLCFVEDLMSRRRINS